MAEQATSHGTPFGHFTFSGQGWSASQVMTQTAPRHSPSVQAASQSAGVASELPPAAPAVPEPPLDAPPVALLPAVLLPPVGLLPPIAELPPADFPALLPTAPPESNKSLFGADPQAATDTPSRMAAHPMRPPRIDPSRIASRV